MTQVHVAKSKTGTHQLWAWPSLSGLLDKFCFFYKVGLSDQCPQPLLHEEKTLPYPGFEPGTFGFQVGNATN